MIQRFTGSQYLTQYAESRKVAQAADQKSNDRNKEVGYVSLSDAFNFVGAELGPGYADTWVSEGKSVTLTPDSYQMSRKTFSNRGDETETIKFQETGNTLRVNHERTKKDTGKDQDFLMADLVIDRETGLIVSHQYQTEKV